MVCKLLLIREYNDGKIPVTYNKTVIYFLNDLKQSWKAFSGIFSSFVVMAFLTELMSEKWVLFRTDLILGKRKKSHGARSGEYGGVPKLQCSFLQETDIYSGLCEHERYRDGVPMHWLPKGSSSCQALILRDVEESLYRRFDSLFGLGVDSYLG